MRFPPNPVRGYLAWRVFDRARYGEDCVGGCAAFEFSGICEHDFSYKWKSELILPLKSGFKRACRRFSGLCTPPAPHPVPKRYIAPVFATWGSVFRAEAAKYALTPLVKKIWPKKKSRNLGKLASVMWSGIWCLLWIDEVAPWYMGTSEKLIRL